MIKAKDIIEAVTPPAVPTQKDFDQFLSQLNVPLSVKVQSLLRGDDCSVYLDLKLHLDLNPDLANKFITGDFDKFFRSIGSILKLHLGQSKYRISDISSNYLFKSNHGPVLLIVQAGSYPHTSSLPVIGSNDARIELSFNLMNLESIQYYISELRSVFQTFIVEVEKFRDENRELDAKARNQWLEQFNKDVAKKANLSIQGYPSPTGSFKIEFLYSDMFIEIPHNVTVENIEDVMFSRYLDTIETKGGPPWVDLEKFVGHKFRKTVLGDYESYYDQRLITIEYSSVTSVSASKNLSQHIHIHLSCLFNNSDCYLSKPKYEDFINAVASVFVRSQKVATFLNNQPVKKTNADW
jgi:hypothetical protein